MAQDLGLCNVANTILAHALARKMQHLGDQAMKILPRFVVVGRCSLPVLVCHSYCLDFVCLWFLSVFDAYWHVRVQSSFRFRNSFSKLF